MKKNIQEELVGILNFDDFPSVECHGHKYWYYKGVPIHNASLCLATKDPEKYCNGVYRYSSKDPGDGTAFIMVKTTDTDYPSFLFPELNKKVFIATQNGKIFVDFRACGDLRELFFELNYDEADGKFILNPNKTYYEIELLNDFAEKNIQVMICHSVEELLEVLTYSGGDKYFPLLDKCNKAINISIKAGDIIDRTNKILDKANVYWQLDGV